MDVERAARANWQNLVGVPIANKHLGAACFCKAVMWLLQVQQQSSAHGVPEVSLHTKSFLLKGVLRGPYAVAYLPSGLVLSQGTFLRVLAEAQGQALLLVRNVPARLFQQSAAV